MQPNDCDLFTLLHKNLPSKIHCSNNKSGANSKPSILSAIALKDSLFIEFNSIERITIVVFDKDHHEGKTAREYFGNLSDFHDWLLEMISILPNYICETTKGYQFGFVIKGFRTLQEGHNPKNSPQHFLSDIKRRYIDYLELDATASGRNKAIFRNPLLHPHIGYTHVTYDLKDLHEALPLEAFESKEPSQPIKRRWSVPANEKITANRNNTIFVRCCRQFSHTKPTKKQIQAFANHINNTQCYEPLPISEIKSISNSIYKNTQQGTLRNGVKKAQINREKMVKERKKAIMKYILKCRREEMKPIKSQLAQNLGISVTALNATYGEFIQMQLRKH